MKKKSAQFLQNEGWNDIEKEELSKVESKKKKKNREWMGLVNTILVDTI